MKNFIIVKSQDRGGSYYIKNTLLPRISVNGRQNYIYDINLEYLNFENKLNDLFDELPDITEFINCVPMSTNSFCNVVFEEATGFFSVSGSSQKILMRHITRKFHTKNFNIFIFHSLLSVPVDILRHIDFIVLFRVGDDEEEVYKKFKAYPNLLSAFKDVQEKTKDTFFNRETGKYKDERSKQFFHYKRIVVKD